MKKMAGLYMWKDILNDSEEETACSVERTLEEGMLGVLFSICRAEVTYWAGGVRHTESVQPLPGW